MMLLPWKVTIAYNRYTVLPVGDLRSCHQYQQPMDLLGAGATTFTGRADGSHACSTSVTFFNGKSIRIRSFFFSYNLGLRD